jgi:hypothetical protein
MAGWIARSVARCFAYPAQPAFIGIERRSARSTMESFPRQSAEERSGFPREAIQLLDE